jgi:hypothetical protein
LLQSRCCLNAVVVSPQSLSRLGRCLIAIVA